MRDPLIASVTVASGQLALCPMPGLTGALTQDLQHIAEFAPDLLISLTEHDEMRRLGDGSLFSQLDALNLQRLHLPIPDYGTLPDVSVWPRLSQKALRLLRAKRRVLVHCRGGCGRSGMIVLRLMIEAGEAPDAALARLRAARPCAVETQAQMDWALALP